MPCYAVPPGAWLPGHSSTDLYCAVPPLDAYHYIVATASRCTHTSSLRHHPAWPGSQWPCHFGGHAPCYYRSLHTVQTCNQRLFKSGGALCCCQGHSGNDNQGNLNQRPATPSELNTQRRHASWQVPPAWAHGLIGWRDAGLLLQPQTSCMAWCCCSCQVHASLPTPAAALSQHINRKQPVPATYRPPAKRGRSLRPCLPALAAAVQQHARQQMTCMWSVATCHVFSSHMPMACGQQPHQMMHQSTVHPSLGLPVMQADTSCMNA